MEVRNILLSMIHPSEMNPRKTVDKEGIGELAENIRNQGLLQPITVRTVELRDEMDDETGEVIQIPKYEIVCGERRYRACSLIGMETIPCIVKDMDDQAAFDAMITENLQRQDVEPLEEAFAFSLLVEKGGSVEDIAIRFGKSARFVSDRIKLNGLIPELKLCVKSGTLPLTAAMMVAKLNDEDQKTFYKADLAQGYSVSVVQTKRWIYNRFMQLDHADWIEDDEMNEPDWTEDFIKCRDCSFNTDNHGCLFHEMRGDGQCTNRTCFEEKKMAYGLYKVLQYGDRLLKEGEELTGDKMVIIDNYNAYTDKDKIRKDRMKEAITAKGYAVVDGSFFRGKCWHSDEDQLKECLERREICKVLSFYSYNDVSIREEYYWFKKEVSSSDCSFDKTGMKVRELMDKNAGIKSKAIESKSKTMRKWAQEKPFHKRKGELTKAELLVLDCFILEGCSADYRKSQGLEVYNPSRNSYAEYIENNTSKREEWYREFIREKLSSASAEYNPMYQRCQDVYFKDAYPDDFRELGEKLAKGLEKKQAKIAEELKELGYDINGNKMEKEA